MEPIRKQAFGQVVVAGNRTASDEVHASACSDPLRGPRELHPLLKLRPQAPRLHGRCTALHFKRLGVRLQQHREYLKELCWLSEREGYCFAYQETLAEKFGVSVATVRNWQTWAVKRNYGTVVRTGRNSLIFPNWETLGLQDVTPEASDQTATSWRSPSLDDQAEAEGETGARRAPPSRSSSESASPKAADPHRQPDPTRARDPRPAPAAARPTESTPKSKPQRESREAWAPDPDTMDQSAFRRPGDPVPPSTPASRPAGQERLDTRVPPRDDASVLGAHQAATPLPVSKPVGSEGPLGPALAKVAPGPRTADPGRRPAPAAAIPARLCFTVERGADALPKPLQDALVALPEGRSALRLIATADALTPSERVEVAQLTVKRQPRNAGGFVRATAIPAVLEQREIAEARATAEKQSLAWLAEIADFTDEALREARDGLSAQVARVGPDPDRGPMLRRQLDVVEAECRRRRPAAPVKVPPRPKAPEPPKPVLKAVSPEENGAHAAAAIAAVLARRANALHSPEGVARAWDTRR